MKINPICKRVMPNEHVTTIQRIRDQRGLPAAPSSAPMPLPLSPLQTLHVQRSVLFGSTLLTLLNANVSSVRTCAALSDETELSACNVRTEARRPRKSSARSYHDAVDLI